MPLRRKHLEHGKCGSIDKHVDNGLVIDGQTLQWILEGHAEDELYKLGMLSIGCVCSRLSPAQKRRLVDVVRKHSNSITLAIGDGANDVPMILGAHVGIGLRGKEGSQAVQASDIAISQRPGSAQPGVIPSKRKKHDMAFLPSFLPIFTL